MKTITKKPPGEGYHGNHGNHGKMPKFDKKSDPKDPGGTHGDNYQSFKPLSSHGGPLQDWNRWSGKTPPFIEPWGHPPDFTGTGGPQPDYKMPDPML